MSLIEKDKAYVWHPFTQAQTFPTPIPVVKAEGVWLYDENGKKYLDANSSWWTVLHGHSNPYMVKMLNEQINELDHVIFAGVTHPKAVEAAERIVKLLPGAFAKAFYSDNGSTSVEVAVKMSLQFWHNQHTPKHKFLAISGAYHGDTFGAMSVGERDKFNKPFEPLFFDVDYLNFPTAENIDQVLIKAEELLSSGNYAAFIFEPLVQGAAGMRTYDASWLDQLIQLAKKYEALTIADEVMTGFYRTGTMFAIERLKEQVDIVCLSKGLTGGILPMGLTLTHQAMYDSFLSDETARAFLHGHSFTGNPIACAAVCASLDLLEQEETLQQVKMIQQKHEKFSKEIRTKIGVKSVHVIGTILSIEVEIGEVGSYFSSMREAAYDYFIEQGILLRPLGNVVFVNPPYCISEEELAFVYEHILKFIDSYKTKNPSK